MFQKSKPPKLIIPSSTFAALLCEFQYPHSQADIDILQGSVVQHLKSGEMFNAEYPGKITVIKVSYI